MATKDTTVSASELCEWLGVGLDALSKLAPRSRVVRASHGRYWLRQSVRTYCDFKNNVDKGKKTTDAKCISDDDPRMRSLMAKARIDEAEADKLEGKQIDTDVALALFADLVSSARAKLLTIPAQVPPEARNTTHDIIHEALEDLSQHDQTALCHRLLSPDGLGVDAAAESDGEPVG